jgi:hypothetical protein
VARDHAKEMATQNYFSHWNLRGYGPDVRYGLAGGTDATMENIYMFWWRYSDGRPAPINDWNKIVTQAQQSLMNSSGHRDNILKPEHTHVGIGMYHHAATGDVRIVQVFVNRYVQLASVPQTARVGQEIEISGHLLNGATNPIVNVAWEPMPLPLSLAQFSSKPNVYMPTNIISQAVLPTVNGTFISAKVKLDSGGRAGLYHIRTFVNVGSRQFMASDAVVHAQ